MSLIKSEHGKKWINTFLAIIGLLVCYVIISFLGTLSEWFDLEAKVTNFEYITTAVGIAGGLASFLLLLKNKKSYTHLNEVYGELLKVVWPEKDAVIKVTIGILIGVSIVSMMFVGVDLLVRFGLQTLY